MLLIVTFAFTNVQCEKSSVEKKDKLPAQTQEGKNTFGCLVDGRVWIPEASTIYPAVFTSVVDNLVSLAAFKDKESIVLRIDNLAKPGIYHLSDAANEFTIGGVEYLLKEGELIITNIDRQRRIISGRFNATGENGGKQVVLSEGRFDLAYHE
nr:DUF6252 family protein [Pedobacter sp. SYSU D00823]